MKRENAYDARYAGKDYYWGKKPSSLCERVLKLLNLSSNNPAHPPRLIDIGCGEGRNAVFFAKSGFDVTGLDISLPGLKKAERYAAQEGVSLTTINDDIRTYAFEGEWDVIFSTGTLHYLPPDLREAWFEKAKKATAPQGLNAFSVLVKKPFLSKAPDAESSAYPVRSGEIMGYYHDWEILHIQEEIFDCMSSGIPHKHGVNRIIARRYEG